MLDPPAPGQEERPRYRPKSTLALKIESLMRRLRRESHPAEDLFSWAMQEAILFDDLLRKAGGDRAVVERLIEYEHQQKPNATRLACLERAIQRWEQENR